MSYEELQLEDPVLAADPNVDPTKPNRAASLKRAAIRAGALCMVSVTLVGCATGNKSAEELQEQNPGVEIKNQDDRTESMFGEGSSFLNSHPEVKKIVINGVEQIPTGETRSISSTADVDVVLKDGSTVHVLGSDSSGPSGNLSSGLNADQKLIHGKAAEKGALEDALGQEYELATQADSPSENHG